MIPVSRTKLPSLFSYALQLRSIWKHNWLTNDGPLVRELESKIKTRLNVKHVICVSSGTAATEISIKALDLKGDVYVSPNSYVSTVATPIWLGLNPIFIDDGEKWKGPAIVTHTYGIPNYQPVHPVIYDGSHCFANFNRTMFDYGDMTIVSFHAVKIFQTGEGGAILTNNDKLAESARWMRNFGHKGQYQYYGAGINCKMSEFHAAMGLCSLKQVDHAYQKYNQLCDVYNQALGYNHQDVTFYPIYYPSERKLVRALPKFYALDIYPRRYFYPPLNKVFKGKSCPIAEEKMKRVLCLPLYVDLKPKDQQKVIELVKSTL